MRGLSLLIALIMVIVPAMALAKKTYIAKSKKAKHKKHRVYKKRIYIKYPVRANTSVSGDEVKLREMLKDIYE